MTYNPFNKALDDLDEEELQKLIDNKIAESWYIEYKESVLNQNGKIDRDKLAKSVSAFANTQGGWLFLGIKADKRNTPFELTGISIDGDKNLLDQISQNISGNIRPVPLFHIKEITLSNQKIVVIIKVEESPLPPYVTSGGSIYQRENSESKPVVDRYIIQKLTEKADGYYDKINNFCRIDYHQSDIQHKTNQAFIELYLFPIPFGTFEFKDFDESIFFEKVVKIFGQGASIKFTNPENVEIASIGMNMNFNAFTTSSESIIVRSIREDTIMHKGMSIELFQNGNIKFHMPINEFDFKNTPDHYKNSPVIDFLKSKYPQTDYASIHFPREKKESEFIANSKMLDGGALLMSIFILGEQIKTFFESSEFDLKKNQFGFRARVTGLWRKFIFFDDLTYLEKLKHFNIPISAKEEIAIPSTEKREYYTLNLSKQYQFLPLGIWILQGIGVPNLSSEEISKIFTHILFKEPLS